jgi:hypothetical protein
LVKPEGKAILTLFWLLHGKICGATVVIILTSAGFFVPLSEARAQGNS